MTTLNFPTSPSLNDVYTANGSSWIWNGKSWVSSLPAINKGYTGSIGYSGSIGYTGSVAVIGVGPTYYAGSTSSFAYASVTTITAINSMSITIPASNTLRMFDVSSTLTYNTHQMRFRIFVDGTAFFPSSGIGISGLNAADGYYSSTISGIIVTIPGDNASHTISLGWEASGSTAGLSVFERSIKATAISNTVNSYLGYTGSASTIQGYTGSIGAGYTGSVGFTGSASTTPGFTGSIGAGYTGSASTVSGYTGSVGATGGSSLNQLSSLTTTSGTEKEFTIPSDAIRITLSFSSVSINASGKMNIQLSTGGVYKTSGYLSAAALGGAASAGTNLTSGFLLVHGGFNINIMSGIVTLINVGGNTWVYSQSSGYDGIPYATMAGGTVTLSGPIDKIKLTTDTGTDTFDSGSLGCIYETPRGGTGYTGSVGTSGPSGYTGSQGPAGGYTGSASTVPGYTGSSGGLINSNQTSAYVITSADNNKLINITTGGVTLNSGTLSVSDSVSIYNNSSSSQTITQGASVTIYIAGTATTGNRTLSQRGLATIICVGTDTYVISGAGLS